MPCSVYPRHPFSLDSHFAAMAETSPKRARANDADPLRTGPEVTISTTPAAVLSQTDAQEAARGTAEGPAGADAPKSPTATPPPVPRLWCKKGESLAALEKADMFKPNPISTSKVWNSGSPQQGFRMMSDGNPQRVTKKKALHSVVCVHRVQIRNGPVDGICGYTMPLGRIRNKDGSFGYWKTSDLSRHMSASHSVKSEKRQDTEAARKTEYATIQSLMAKGQVTKGRKAIQQQMQALW